MAVPSMSWSGLSCWFSGARGLRVELTGQPGMHRHPVQAHPCPRYQRLSSLAKTQRNGPTPSPRRYRRRRDMSGVPGDTVSWYCVDLGDPWWRGAEAMALYRVPDCGRSVDSVSALGCVGQAAGRLLGRCGDHGATRTGLAWLAAVRARRRSFPVGSVPGQEPRRALGSRRARGREGTRRRRSQRPRVNRGCGGRCRSRLLELGGFADEEFFCKHLECRGDAPGRLRPGSASSVRQQGDEGLRHVGQLSELSLREPMEGKELHEA